jgi:hypothetical protein
MADLFRVLISVRNIAYATRHVNPSQGLGVASFMLASYCEIHNNSLLQSRMIPSWIGWTTLVWNIAWLVALPVVSPTGIYFPVLHHVLPLVIGIALLTRAP